MEQWKICEEFNLYEVSDLGRIRRIDSGRVLKASIVDGYYKVGLSINGKTTSRKIHRLIAKAFVDNPNNYDIVNHKDGNKLNSAALNLEWGTQKDNIDHAWRTGLMSGNIGDNNPNTKVPDSEIENVKSLYNQGMLQKHIARIYNVYPAVISNIINNKRYFSKNIPSNT